MATSTASPSPTVPLTVDNGIDIAAALVADDATLTAAIELARQWMRNLRSNRGSLAFTDAKRADTVLTAALRARKVATHRATSPAPAPRLHPCNAGCTNSTEPVSSCACECLGANHKQSTVVVETFPQRTVYAHAEQLAPTVWIGYAALGSHFGAWDVCRVLDRGVTRTFDALRADFPDRASAEKAAYALATGGAA